MMFEKLNIGGINQQQILDVLNQQNNLASNPVNSEQDKNFTLALSNNINISNNFSNPKINNFNVSPTNQ